MERPTEITLDLIACRERRRERVQKEIADYLLGEFQSAEQEGGAGYFLIGVSAVLEAMETEQLRNPNITVGEVMGGIKAYFGKLVRASLGEEE